MRVVTRSEIVDAVRNRESFKNSTGNLRGLTCYGVYHVYSYDTLVATSKGDVNLVTNEKYSKTTSQHVSQILKGFGSFELVDPFNLTNHSKSNLPTPIKNRVKILLEESKLHPTKNQILVPFFENCLNYLSGQALEVFKKTFDSGDFEGECLEVYERLNSPEHFVRNYLIRNCVDLDEEFAR